MNSILTKCFSCCGRESEITNSVFNIKENRKISNSFSNIYSKIKSKGSNSVTNLKKTNATNQKKYSFVNFPLSSEEDISSKQKVKSENSFSIKKKPTKKKVTYRGKKISICNFFVAEGAGTRGEMRSGFTITSYMGIIVKLKRPWSDQMERKVKHIDFLF